MRDARRNHPKRVPPARGRKSRRTYRLFAAALCLLVIALSLGYILHWELSRRRIERDNAAFSALYRPERSTAAPETRTAAPTATLPPTHEAMSTPTATVQAASTSPVPTASAPAPSAAQPIPEAASTSAAKIQTAATAQPAAAPTATVQAAYTPPAPAAQATLKSSPAPAAKVQTASAPPTVSATTVAPTITPTPSPAPTPEPFAIALDATRAPLATPDADTRVYALQTPPPAQPSFADLLATNPDTVAFLRIPDVLSLPVVQRKNDNETYLNHSFNLEESIAGTLFLDGANLLVPEDSCLIVYGHNMRNGTMFHHLLDYAELPFLKAHALVRFDTLYENRSYAPFAVLTVTAGQDSPRYMDLREFSLDGDAFDAYVARLRSLSMWEIPLEVRSDDRLLLLVTCEYTHDNGRFVVALRQLRPDERAEDVQALIQSTKAR